MRHPLNGRDPNIVKCCWLNTGSSKPGIVTWRRYNSNWRLVLYDYWESSRSLLQLDKCIATPSARHLRSPACRTSFTRISATQPTSTPISGIVATLEEGVACNARRNRTYLRHFPFHEPKATGTIVIMATATPQAIVLVMNSLANALGEHVEEIIRALKALPQCMKLDAVILSRRTFQCTAH